MTEGLQMKRLTKIMLICAVVLVASAYVVSAATSGKYTYTTSSGKATITDVDSSISGDVVIPSTLGGCPVTAIADNAFFLCKAITGVTIPDTVISIGNSAFYECSSLEKIEIPFSVKTIKKSTFSGCGKLKEINVASENEHIRFTDGVIYCDDMAVFCSNAYCTENNINEVYVAEGTTKIGSYAFAKCDGITRVELPESIIAIGDKAFEVCKNLKEVSIEGELTSIGEYAFMENFALESVTYNGANEPILGDGVFESCTALKVVTVSSGYQKDTFGGYPVSKISSDVKLSFSQDGATITVENVPYNCKLIVAYYEDKELTECIIKDIWADCKLDVENYETNTVKVFLWKDLIDFKPLCQCEEK